MKNYIKSLGKTKFRVGQCRPLFSPLGGNKKQTESCSYCCNPHFPEKEIGAGDVKSFPGCKLVSGRKRKQTQVGLTTEQGHCPWPVQKGRVFFFFFSASTGEPLEVWSQAEKKLDWERSHRVCLRSQKQALSGLSGDQTLESFILSVSKPRISCPKVSKQCPKLSPDTWKTV